MPAVDFANLRVQAEKFRNTDRLIGIYQPRSPISTDGISSSFGTNWTEDDGVGGTVVGGVGIVVGGVGTVVGGVGTVVGGVGTVVGGVGTVVGGVGTVVGAVV